MRELQEFCKIAEQAGGLRVDDDKARIFKVLPMPISPDEHPPELKEFTGYEFYAIDIVTNKAQEFVPELGEEAYRNSWRRPWISPTTFPRLSSV